MWGAPAELDVLDVRQGAAGGLSCCASYSRLSSRTNMSSTCSCMNCCRTALLLLPAIALSTCGALQSQGLTSRVLHDVTDKRKKPHPATPGPSMQDSRALQRGRSTCSLPSDSRKTCQDVGAVA